MADAPLAVRLAIRASSQSALRLRRLRAVAVPRKAWALDVRAAPSHTQPAEREGLCDRAAVGTAGLACRPEGTDRGHLSVSPAAPGWS